MGLILLVLLLALLFGFSPLPAFLVGASLSMSSTAVVALLLCSHGQRSLHAPQNHSKRKA